VDAIQGQMAYFDVRVMGNICREFGRIPSIYGDDMVMFQCCVNCQNTRLACSAQYENLLAIPSRHAAMITLGESDEKEGGLFI
jgi:hypothetical protein